MISRRLVDLTTRHRAETEMETQRLRSSQTQAEKTLEARERAHRQRVKGLEEQVGAASCGGAAACVAGGDAEGPVGTGDAEAPAVHFTQRSGRRRDQRHPRHFGPVILCACGGCFIAGCSSLTNVSRDNELDPLLLEHEARKLDETAGYHSAAPP